MPMFKHIQIAQNKIKIWTIYTLHNSNLHEINIQKPSKGLPWWWVLGFTLKFMTQYKLTICIYMQMGMCWMEWDLSPKTLNSWPFDNSNNIINRLGWTIISSNACAITSWLFSDKLFHGTLLFNFIVLIMFHRFRNGVILTLGLEGQNMYKRSESWILIKMCFYNWSYFWPMSRV